MVVCVINHSLATVICHSNNAIFFISVQFVVGTSGSSNYRPGFELRNNRFVSNQCEHKGVIDIRSESKLLLVIGNLFYKNRGVSILIEGSVGFAPSRIGFNVFEENSSPKGSVVELMRIERDTAIANNTFIKNTCRSVLLFQIVYGVKSTTIKIYCI